MSSAMFIHRVQPLKKQASECRLMGLKNVADQIEAILRRIDNGNIKTVAQLNKAQEQIKWQ